MATSDAARRLNFRLPQVPDWLRARRVTTETLQSVWARWEPPTPIATREWADRYLYLPPDSGSAKPGKYRSAVTPWIWAIQDAIDDPAVREIVCMKSSQVAWTIGAITAYVCKRIDNDPCPIVMMFPTTDAGREYSQEKFTEIASVTPRIAEKIDTRSRKSGNRALFKKFAGGFLKMVGSNSPRSVKSSSAPVLIIEEPDDASSNVKGQGDSIALLRDRAKTHPNHKIIFGGTPTISGLSKIEWAFKSSDQRKLFVPCHHCGEEHVLLWDQVKWDEHPEQKHEIYGAALPETAFYVCPHCGGTWTDYEKNQNVRRACFENRWKATASFTGVVGFGNLSELYMPWENSRLQDLVRRFAKAKKKSEEGDDSELVTFYNGVLGVPYEYGGKATDLAKLESGKLPYTERTIPAGGLLLTMGVDTQHDRLAIVIRAWGRGEESWLVYFGEIYGHVTDRKDGIWAELEQIAFGPYRNPKGRETYVAALSIDSGDGVTSDAVYDWARQAQRRHPRCRIMPVKGSSDNADKEIFSLPKPSIDHRTITKAAKYGLRVYIVGTNKAKDLLLGGERQSGRLHLSGSGPGRFHIYKDVRADYLDQLTSEVKAPSRRLRGRLVWQLRSGRRNEALDCEVYALHAARSLRTNVMTPAHWDAIEHRAQQADLFTETEQPDGIDQQTTNDQQNSTISDAPGSDSGSVPAPPNTIRRTTPPPKGGFVNRWRR